MKDIPLPNLTLAEVDPRLLTELAAFGKEIADGNPSEAADSEEIVRTIYRVNENLE